MSAESITRPTWFLALETLRSPSALVCLLIAVLLDLLGRSMLPLAIAASNARGTEIGLELRHVLLGALTLLALLRYRRWAAAFRGQEPHEAALIFILSGSYLHLFGWVSLSTLETTLGLRPPQLGGGALLESAWFSSLAAILALSRLESASLAWAYVTLAWWVPALAWTGFPGASEGVSGISHAAWSASGILPMLIPQLLGFGFVCLERSHR